MTLSNLESSLNSCKLFVDHSLEINRSTRQVTGFHLAPPLLAAASHNTYVETVSDKADSLNRYIKHSLTSCILHTYLHEMRRLSRIKGWQELPVMLAFDYTEENFYGDVQGVDIHGWTCQDGVTGKFKFLTCSIVSDEIPEKIPLLSVPIMIGHYKSHVVEYMLRLVSPLVGEIKLLLFDRGFCDNDLMYELNQQERPYLIFIPKQKDKQEKLLNLDEGEQIAIREDFFVKKQKTKFYDERYMVFLRQIYNEKNDEKYDWVFSTNVEEVALGNIIAMYKKRWCIETGFRVQDEARIKSKSTDLKTRYFLFLFTQLLQANWMCFYKNEVSFKKYLIALDAYAQAHLERHSKHVWLYASQSRSARFSDRIRDLKDKER